MFTNCKVTFHCASYDKIAIFLHITRHKLQTFKLDRKNYIFNTFCRFLTVSKDLEMFTKCTETSCNVLCSEKHIFTPNPMLILKNGDTCDDRTSILRGFTCNTDAIKEVLCSVIFYAQITFFLIIFSHRQGGFAPRQAII